MNVLNHSIMNVLNHSKVTKIFKCVVRVVAVQPYQAENFCSLVGKYMTRLTLENQQLEFMLLYLIKTGKLFLIVTRTLQI
jgi:hypothetical protein